MIDINNETLISLTEAARTLPSRHPGKRLHVSTIWRWVTYGCKGIRLETCRIGGSVFTSREAIARFSQAMTEPRMPDPKHRPDRRPSLRQIEAAESACQRHGI